MIYTSLTVTPLAFSASSSRASFGVVEQRANVVERAHGCVELLSSGFEARVFCLVGQIVSPAALQLDVVVDLLNHLLELAGVNAVGAI